MIIKKATVKEIDDIVMLNSFVQRIHVAQHPNIFKPPDLNEKKIKEFYTALLKEESDYLFIAYIKLKPVGYIWFAHDKFKENPFKYSRDQLYIHQIVVHEDFRCQSVGNGLMEKLKEIGKELNIHHFQLDSWEFNEDAHGFFRKEGFTTFNRNMWLTT